MKLSDGIREHLSRGSGFAKYKIIKKQGRNTN